jgi:hypothetical protein
MQAEYQSFVVRVLVRGGRVLRGLVFYSPSGERECFDDLADLPVALEKLVQLHPAREEDPFGRHTRERPTPPHWSRP